MTHLQHFKDNAEMDSYVINMLSGANRIKAACIVFGLIVLAAIGVGALLQGIPW